MFAMARRSYNVAFKLKAIATTDGGSKQAAACRFKIDTTQVTEWSLQEEKLTALKKEGRR